MKATSSGRRWCLRAACAAAVALASPLMTAAAPPSTQPGRYAAQLVKECDALLATAVRRPYGWAWADGEGLTAEGGGAGVSAVPADGEHRRPNRVPAIAVSLAPGATPSAGLVLLRASEAVAGPADAARLFDASLQVARGLSAAQQSNGRVPAVALFGTSVAAREEATPMPDRAPTRAALGLFLSLVEHRAKVGGKGAAGEEFVAGAARRAALWHLKQQPAVGAWSVAYAPATHGSFGLRVVRLDGPDFRDDTFAALLAAAVLNDAAQKISAERATEFLLRLRLDQTARFGAGLWVSAYNLDASVCEQIKDLPPAVDALATRYALQTLLGSLLVIDDGPAGDALAKSASSIARLASDDGRWNRLIDPFDGNAKPPAEPTTGPAVAASRAFRERGAWGLPPVLDAARRIRSLGPDAYVGRLGKGFDYRQHLAHALCGLDDAALTFDLPTTPAEFDAYLRRQGLEAGALEGDVPPDLAARVQRLWMLVLRARIESATGK